MAQNVVLHSSASIHTKCRGLSLLQLQIAQFQLLPQMAAAYSGAAPMGQREEVLVREAEVVAREEAEAVVVAREVVKV